MSAILRFRDSASPAKVPLGKKPVAGSRLFLSGLVLLAAASSTNGQSAKPSVGVAVKTVTVQLDDAKTYQTIDNFSASDAWACQFVGQWPAAKKEAMADLLFSTEDKAGGQPKGIGLSMWRFNIGAGSTQQGEQSGIRDEWHRAESFMLPDGRYDWTRQAGQVWFLQAAKKRGVKQFLGFLNSPPVQYTVTGKAFAEGGKTNLAPANYEPLATFIANVVQGVKKTTGITFDYISPVNEPQWDWSDPKQEGSPFRNEEIAGVTKALNTALVAQQLPTKILLTEAGKINYLFATEDKPNRGEQINAFFSPTAASTYVGNLPSVAHTVAAHSYFTTSPYTQAVATRQQLAAKVATVDKLTFWQSEYCILGDNAGEINGNKRDLGMDAALYLARTIHMDLAVANAAAWQWWLAISPYDYKDGLIYIDKTKEDGNYQVSKMLWALGNYSRYLRPGAVRVDARIDQASANDNQLLVSAYKNVTGKQLITVVVNSASTPTDLRLTLSQKKIGAVRTYTTSATADLQPGAVVKAGQLVHLAPRSITTLVSDIR
ncbi:glycoside hydrolase [Hymenobacter sp. GOD-10R]|uniref:glycoside hydrolase n=1 Tax=Hymenobacter sp. GOD-10R TaxID=3093922 RepID=UPI002D781FEB|nr:glycoside hydrolase [Hymenobacter sp. GOD-10R]WRQ28200.1 glycoside hydrolase [Hymenobacter sp. GOD-10R]